MSTSTQRVAEVCETGRGPYQNMITLGEHHLLAGEPKDVGGDDSGPTPMELAAAALGACTTITLRMYAVRKSWPLERISATVSYKRGPREECSDTGNDADHRPGMVDIFTRTITLEGPLNAEQRTRLMQISEKCPVHKALAGNACIRTSESNEH